MELLNYQLQKEVQRQGSRPPSYILYVWGNFFILFCFSKPLIEKWEISLNGKKAVLFILVFHPQINVLSLWHHSHLTDDAMIIKGHPASPGLNCNLITDPNTTINSSSDGNRQNYYSCHFSFQQQAAILKFMVEGLQLSNKEDV